MTWKILGAMLIIGSCGAFAFSLCAATRREEAYQRQLITALDYMQCELQYRLTPLPELCRLAGREQKGIVGKLLEMLSQELENQISPNVSCCVGAVLARIGSVPPKLKKAFTLLGNSLGRFDVQGQLTGLEQVRQYCREQVAELSDNREARLRSYQTLGLCAGAALAILFV